MLGRRHPRLIKATHVLLQYRLIGDNVHSMRKGGADHAGEDVHDGIVAADTSVVTELAAEDVVALGVTYASARLVPVRRFQVDAVAIRVNLRALQIRTEAAHYSSVPQLR